MQIDTSVLVDLADIMNNAHRMRINNNKIWRIKFFHLQVGSREFWWARWEEMDHTHTYVLCVDTFLN